MITQSITWSYLGLRATRINTRCQLTVLRLNKHCYGQITQGGLLYYWNRSLHSLRLFLLQKEKLPKLSNASIWVREKMEGTDNAEIKRTYTCGPAACACVHTHTYMHAYTHWQRKACETCPGGKKREKKNEIQTVFFTPKTYNFV